MKKLQLTALVLALVFVLASCAALGSIFGDKNPEEVPNENVIDLAAYKIIYSRMFKASSVMGEKITEFSAAVESKTGVRLLSSRDTSVGAVENDDCEILLGSTSRPQSEQALKLLEGKNGYVITRIGKKILINGTSDYCISLGMQAFVEKCLQGETLREGKVELQAGFVEKNDSISTVTYFGDSTTRKFIIVYDRELDVTDGSIYGAASSTTFGGHDYLYDQALEYREDLIRLSGGKGEVEDIPVVPDSTAMSGSVEVSFGKTTRPVSESIAKELAANEYGFRCQNGQLALFGWTENTVLEAAKFMEEMMPFFMDYKSGVILFPNHTTIKRESKNFAADVPTFAYGTFVGAQDSGSGSINKNLASSTLLQVFEKVKKSDYDAYCKTLQNAGYRVYTSNTNKNTDLSRDNFYATYVNDTTMVHIYYIATASDEGEVRLISSKLDNMNLPNINEEAYDKVTEPMLTQMRLGYYDKTYAAGKTDPITGQTLTESKRYQSFGMCYIYTCEDGSFIIYDGGGDSGDGDRDRIYTILTELYTKTFGHAPTEEKPIVIAAWVITHYHWDHYTNFVKFCRQYTRGDVVKVKLEKFICNLGSLPYVYNAHNPGGYNLNAVIDLSNNAKFPFEIVEVHTGQKLYIRNVMMEILYTQEDLFPQPLWYYNNTSLITRLHMRVSTGKNADGTHTYAPYANTVLMLGDLHYQGSLRLETMYGREVKPTAFLKSDVVQVAHHGWNGCTQELYDVVDAKVLIWPAKMSVYTGLTTGTKNQWYKVDDTADSPQYNVRAIDRWLEAEKKDGRWAILLADVNNYTIFFTANPIASTGGVSESILISSGVVSIDYVAKGKNFYDTDYVGKLGYSN